MLVTSVYSYSKKVSEAFILKVTKTWVYLVNSKISHCQLFNSGLVDFIYQHLNISDTDPVEDCTLGAV